MEWVKGILKEHIDAEKLDDVIEAFKQEFPKHAMPKDKFNETNQELKAAREQLDEQKKLAEQLTAKADSVEEYEQKLKEWEQQYQELETKSNEKISHITKRTQLSELLVRAGLHENAHDLIVDNPKYLDKVEMDDEGKVKDPEALVNSIKQERAGLFIEEQQQSKDTGAQNAQTAVKDPKEMNMEEYAAWFEQQQTKSKNI